MRHLIGAALAAGLIWASAPAIAQQPIPSPPSAETGATPEQLLDALIRHSRHVATLSDVGLAGEGGAFLKTLGGASQFVLIGESHGNEGVAKFATAYWRDLNALGFNYAVIETDPWIAEAAERELRAGGVDAWAKFSSARGGAMAAPFLAWAPEAALAADIVTRSKARGAPALWGVDQVFIGAAPWMMREIAERAHTPAARAAAAKLVSGTVNPMTWFTQVDPQALVALRATLTDRRDADYARLVDAMIPSQRIYRPFTGGGGEAFVANTERERIFRRLFAEHYARAEAADRAPPRVMAKLGANHVFRGAAINTQIQGFGGFVTEFATQRGTEALTILALCGKGGGEANLSGQSTPCADDDFHKMWTFLHPHVDPQAVTIFDLRTWRLRPRRWASLPADVQRIIGSYDVLVFAPATSGSPLLQGVAPLAQQ